MFDHMLNKSGDLMVGARYMYGTQSGDMLHGLNNVSDRAIVDSGCNGNPCFTNAERDEHEYDHARSDVRAH
jgi:hypothetical protein